MVKKFLKFINKSIYKEVLLQLLEDLATDNLATYDIKPLAWKLGYYRIRIGKIRIIYTVQNWENMIVTIDNRWDIY